MSKRKYCVYKFKKGSEVLYVGKSINVFKRIRRHINSKKWIKEGIDIFISEVDSRTDMDIYELYYINKLNPTHNIASLHNDKFSIALPDLSFTKYKTLTGSDFPKNNNPQSDCQTYNNNTQNSIIDELLLDEYILSSDLLVGNNQCSSDISKMIEGGLISFSDGAKVIRVILYMYENTVRGYRIKFTLRNLIEECGFTYKSGKNSSQGIFKNVLSAIDEFGYFGESGIDFQNIKPNEVILLSAKNLPDSESNKNNVDTVRISKEEIERISIINGVDINQLLTLYIFIKIKTANYLNNPLYIPTKKEIATELFLSSTSVNLYINKLKNAGMVVDSNTGIFTDSISN